MIVFFTMVIMLAQASLDARIVKVYGEEELEAVEEDTYEDAVDNVVEDDDNGNGAALCVVEENVKSDVSKFVLDYICSRFGTPLEILSDRGPGFTADLLDALLENLSIKHVHSTPYYPQCNDLVEKTNGVLCKIITKHVKDRPQDWDKHLTAALWAYRTSFKVSTQFTPYHLVYVQEALLPIEVELGSLRVLARETTSSKEKLEQRILDLQRLELDREAITDYYITQANKKREEFNNKVKEKKLEEGMLVMRTGSGNWIVLVLVSQLSVLDSGYWLVSGQVLVSQLSVLDWFSAGRISGFGQSVVQVLVSQLSVLDCSVQAESLVLVSQLCRFWSVSCQFWTGSVQAESLVLDSVGSGQSVASQDSG
ncbi:hypothetical protein L7F22_001966 [Adiantum nelumboides]|nr:hypothetical protein [Adiantum nelumboides]